MENRFGMKDAIVVVLLIAVIVVVGLAMHQYDRQMDRLVSIDTQLKLMNEQSAQQGRTLQQISQQLASGLTVATTQSSGSTTKPTAPDTADANDAFWDLRNAQKNKDFAQGDWLITNLGTKVSKLTPLLSSDVYASIIQNRIMESMAYRDPDTLEYRPLMAKGWDEPILNVEAWQKYVDSRMAVPLTEDEVKKEKDYPPAEKADDQKKYLADRMKEGRRLDDIISEPDCPVAVTYTFHIRQGVQFSNGDPMTADDYAWTFGWIMNEAVNAPRTRAFFARIRSVEAKGSYDVVVKFKEPYFESFGLAAGLTPMDKKFYSRFTPQQFNDQVGLLIGTGPYRMQDPENWRPGKPLELVRNERYWGVPGAFDRLYYHEVEEDAAELTMFRNGELDTFAAQPEQYLSMQNDESINKRSQNYKYYSRDGGYTYVAWNQVKGGKPTRFADKRVRQAMTMLIDRNRMVEEIFRGFAKPAAGPFGLVSKQNDPSVTPWPYDFKRAIALLAEAGYSKKDAQGVLLGPDGEPFRFQLVYNNKNPIGEQMALLMKDSLARAGIVMQQEPTDWPIMIKKLDQQDFDAITLGWTGGIETDIFQMFHSSQIGNGADNFMSYRNPELDKLMETARRTVDEDQRMPIWRKCHQILHEDQPYTFLLFRQSLMYVDKRIQNVRQTKSGLNYISTDDMPIPWYVPTASQRHK